MPNQFSELAAKRAAAAIRMYVAGDTLRSIAKTLGVSKQRVWFIVETHRDRDVLRAKHDIAKREARQRRLYTRCRVCGTGFVNHTGSRSYCSDRCRDYARRRRQIIAKGLERKESRHAV